jgi:putative transport protein
VAILVGRFGPNYHMVTYATTSANRMVREIGLALFLASVGLGAGGEFFSTIATGGWVWILYGVVITMLPLLIMGFIARKWGKLDYFTLMGLMAGSTTDPPALAFAAETSDGLDNANVAYATVYPLTMFLRVMVAQLLIIFFCA